MSEEFQEVAPPTKAVEESQIEQNPRQDRQNKTGWLEALARLGLGDAILRIATGGLTLLALAAALGPASDALRRLGSPMRQILTALLVVPAGFLMGVPFSGGLIRLAGPDNGRIAWAWAVNGAASGVAGVLTALVSLQAGLGAAIVLGAVAYGVAGAAAPAAPSDRASG